MLDYSKLITIRVNKEARLSYVDEDKNDCRFQNLRHKYHRETKDVESWGVLAALETCRQNTHSLKNH